MIEEQTIDNPREGKELLRGAPAVLCTNRVVRSPPHCFNPLDPTFGNHSANSSNGDGRYNNPARVRLYSF